MNITKMLFLYAAAILPSSMRKPAGEEGTGLQGTLFSLTSTVQGWFFFFTLTAVESGFHPMLPFKMRPSAIRGKGKQSTTDNGSLSISNSC